MSEVTVFRDGDADVAVETVEPVGVVATEVAGVLVVGGRGALLAVLVAAVGWLGRGQVDGSPVDPLAAQLSAVDLLAGAQVCYGRARLCFHRHLKNQYRYFYYIHKKYDTYDTRKKKYYKTITSDALRHHDPRNFSTTSFPLCSYNKEKVVFIITSLFFNVFIIWKFYTKFGDKFLLFCKI
jgi:hypothetical protein